MRSSTLLGLLVFTWWKATGPVQASEGLYRFPALHGETIVFTSEGDLWRVPITGGVAQRLTTHPGMESHATLSPDGTTIAFAAEYEGPREVYTMPLAGGRPVRQTFDGTGSTPANWTPDGNLLVRSVAMSTLPEDQLSVLDPVTASRRWLPLAQATDGIFDPTTGTLYFTRFPKQGSSTKRYRGGWIENLWRFAPGDTEAAPLTASFPGTSRNPMWWNDRLYFLSDRSGILNVWSIRTDGSDPQPHTEHADFDVVRAALHRGRIVYQQGADLRVLDIDARTNARVPITLASDFDQQRERWVRKPLDFLTAAHPSPNGDRIVLTARGQVFVAPVGQGRLVEIPRGSNIRYREARFLPDGKGLLALSDATGELEFWRLPADGLSSPQPLTTNGTVFRFAGVPSPDGERFAWSDKNQRLWVHHIPSRQSTLVAESRMDPFTELAWSPDSAWLAYVETATNTYRQIHVWKIADGQRIALTSDRTDSYSPAWSPDGRWMYFLSDRTLRSLVPSPWGPRQPEPFFTDTTRIYQLALRPGERSPFAPLDELMSSSSAGNGPGATNAPSPQTTVIIDANGLADRLEEVPVPAGNYSDLTVTSRHLLWVAIETGFDAKPQLKQLEITHKDPKPKTLAEDIKSYELTVDRKKLLVSKGDDFFVVPSDSAAPAKLEDKARLDSWTFSIEPREEWRQIYTESWRMLRDYFYDRGMHQVDWPGIHAKYLPLLARVRDRAELSHVIAEMVGELSTLHIYVAFGDLREGPDKIATAALGAHLVRDEPAGGWRIEALVGGDPDYPGERSPLARPGMDVKAGDVILTINGRPTLEARHPSELLRNQAGQQVLIEVRSPGQDTTRRAVVKPITAAQEAELRYASWQYSRRQRVEELGAGRIGYVHLKAMGTPNIAEWARQFYPVFQRQGLIIDVRHNRGGNIDAWILGRLLRQAWFYWQPAVGDPYWNMHFAFRGHIVVLCNEHTASDGEAFAEGFRRLGLGKVIGTRTWGGEIWLSSRRWLVDSGMATAAEIGVYGPEGEWLIEGHGVEPDVVVDNLPHATYQGRDLQLETAVDHLQQLIARDPRPVPPRPPYPSKAFP